MAFGNIINIKHEIAAEGFSIPPFEMKSGEIIIINLQPTKDLYKTENELVCLLTGKTSRDEIIIFESITFVEHYKQPKWRQLLYPVTVGEYLRNNANSDSSFGNKIYELAHISKRSKIESLSFKDKRFLCLFSALSNTKNIVLDFVGLSFDTIDTVYEILLEVVRNGGSVIILDTSRYKESECSKFIELAWKD